MKKFLTVILTIITIVSNAQVLYDFESGDLSAWTQKPENRWGISTDNPLSGSGSLKHVYDNSVAYTDTIYTALPKWNISNGDVTWQFLLKHAYDPSSANRWWVYLMADSSLLETSGCSGYAVGVNLTGSDDLLKLWRVDNGVPQVILTSTLNWQTSIGTSGVGAVEVTRTADGTFTLKASPLGSFNELQNFGEVMDVIYSKFLFFGVFYNYSSTQDMKLWVDDVSFLYQPQNPNDNTSIVDLPVAQIPEGYISSLNIASEQAVDVFKIAVSDDGAADNLPTSVTRLTFKNLWTSSFPWSHRIGGVKLKDGIADLPLNQVVISDNQIEIFLDSTVLSIPDGQSKEVTLSVYLKQGGVVDGDTLQFYVDSVNHGCISTLSGSGFAKVFPQKVISNIFRVQVNATSLRFKSIPAYPIIGKDFGIEVFACDTLGNVDSDFSDAITLELVNGSGSLQSDDGLVHNAVDGEAIWNFLTYSKAETVSLRATSDGLSEAVSQEFTVHYDTTSYATESETQPVAIDVSSANSSPASAFEAFRVKVTDVGGDEASTYVESLTFQRMSGTNVASLSKVVGGVLVKINSTYVGIASLSLTTSSLKIIFPAEQLIVLDDSSITLNIWIYLKTVGLIDGQTIGFKVESDAHAFSAFSGGTSFTGTFPTTFSSPVFTINNKASALEFENIPSQVGVSVPFTFNVNAVDGYGNTDADFNGTVSIGKASGEGALSVDGGSEVNINGGTATVTASYNKVGSFSVMAVSDSLLSVTSAAITCSDNDAFVLPLTQPADTVVFTVESSSTDSAKEIGRFKVKDFGSTDSLPTNVKRIVFHPFNAETLGQLRNIIGGVLVKKDTVNITPESFVIDEDGLTIDFSEGQLLVNDGDSANVYVLMYLKQNGLPDGLFNQFFIPASGHDWETYSNGTSFSSNFPSSIYCQPFKINVEANSLSFSDYPLAVGLSEPFDLVAYASDSYSNIDLDFSGYATLVANSDANAVAIPTPLSSLNGGIAGWTNVFIDSVGRYGFRTYYGSLADGFTQPIYCGYSSVLNVDEQFEGELPNWDGISDWSISSVNPIDGDASLVHAGSPDAGKSYFSIPLNENSDGKAVEWRFTIKNGSWDPSASNYFYFVLGSTSSNFEEGRGYAIGVNPSINSNLITLWSFQPSEKEVLLSVPYEWSSNNEISFWVTLLPNGKLQLRYKPDKIGVFLNAGTIDVDTIPLNYCGFEFNYTSTRAGSIWLDNIMVKTVSFPPLIKSAKPLSQSAVRLKFSKNVDAESAQNVEHYSILKSDKSEQPILQVVYNENEKDEVVLLTDPLPFGELMLKVEGVKDENGYATVDSIKFGLSTEGSLGRLVINEVMPNPLPSKGLPEYEYIELYNPTNDTIFTYNWKLQCNTTVVSLPNDTIFPKEYVIIGSQSAVNEFDSFGKCIAVSSFPSLLNSGMLIKLFDPEGNLASFVNYLDSWYPEGSTVGGTSLERIDPQNIAEGKQNWHVSADSQGGTPGKVNSVVGSNPDITIPFVSYVEVLSAGKLRIGFSEPMDTLSITLNQNYYFDDEDINPQVIVVSGSLFDAVDVSLSGNMQAGETYWLSLNNMSDFAGNVMPSTQVEIGIPENPLEGDIVINEVLFNPYSGGVDFVELYNNSSKIIDLQQLSLANRNTTTLELKDVVSASDTSKLLFPEEFAVITVNPQLIQQFYYCQNPSAFVHVASMPSYSNDLGYVVLLSDSVVIDEMQYSESMHSKIINDPKGVSLERINPNLQSFSQSSWQSASQNVGFATPTYKNSQYSDLESKTENFTLSTDIISPDGDGKDDYLLISYNLPEPGFIANIAVYSANGILIKRLANNLTLGTTGAIRWDGVDSSNNRVSLGIYIIYIEYYNLGGTTKRLKRVCSVAEK
ncbi:MAG: lamin tail domain-containing protein [Bacteroidales bacterium]|nr:lamin tail domain-containing protein [Bacteroidales bacterium]